MKMSIRCLCVSTALLLAIAATGCGSSSSPCPAGQLECGGICLDTSSDRNHCGSCENACLSGQECISSICTACNNECSEGDKRCAPSSTTQFQVCGDPDNDTCKEWQAPQNCGAGEICTDGDCVTSCSDECTRVGAQACDKEGANGYRVCGEYDSDDCLDWGSLNTCGVGLTCVDGNCVSTCSDECDTQDATRCAQPPKNGVETCGDYNSDGCKEWGDFYACPSGETCDGNVTCSPDCSDECTTGERTCDGAGYRTCGQHDADLCLDWSAVTDCQSWEVCNPANGQCQTACSDECQQGQRQCHSDTEIDLCANYDADPCLEWGIIDTCNTGEKCTNGQCVEDCKNECEPQGDRMCQNIGSDAGYRVCGDWDSDSCLEWGNPIPCDAGQSCSDGVCADTCTDECDVGQKECSGTGFHQCGESGDGDTCRDWLAVVPCEDWEVCDQLTATCVVNCTNECSPAASKTCDGDNSGYMVCGNWNPDPCLEWSDVNECGAGKICDPAFNDCVDDCSDECPGSGSKQCADADTWQTCANWDSDSCLEWGGDTDCQSGYVCSNGSCASSCSDECTTAATTVCDGTGGWRLCDYLDADPCLDLGSFNACAGNEECQDGSCVVVCTDDCTPNDLQCSAGNDAVEVCAADGDSDPCFEWKTQQSCTAGTEVCHQAQCVSTTAPATLVVSKLLYDCDGYPDTDYAYIEIFGPAGLNLNHYSLVGVNGNGGSDYVEFDLSGYTMPDDGHFVVAPSSTLWDQSLVDIFDDNADLQNGPDGVQVRWAGQTVVDGLAYEGTGTGTPQGGEGSPAPSAKYDTTNGITYCLARRYDNDSGTYLDTNDNSIDFMTRTYCQPGGAGYGLRLAEYNTFSNVDATPAVDPLTGAVFAPSYDYFDEVLPDFSSYAWYDVVIGDKSSPALSADGTVVYVGICAGAGASDSGLRAYQTAAGGATFPTVLWTAADTIEVRSSPAVGADGSIYFGTRGAGFMALNSDGSQKWVPYPETNWIDSSPALGNIGTGGVELVVFGVGGVGSGKVVALNAATGAEVWSDSTPTGGCNGSPGIGSDGTVYIGCDDGYLYAFDGATGAARTGFPVLISADSGGSPEMVDGRSVAVAPDSGGGDVILATSSGSDTNFNIINSDASILSYNMGPAPSSVTITGDGGFLFVYGNGAGGAFVVAYGPQWTLEWYDYIGTSDDVAWITSSPNALDVGYGQVYIGTHDGKIYVYYWAAGLFDGAGSFPKFRGDLLNSGRGF